MHFSNGSTNFSHTFRLYRVFQKTDHLDYFDDNFGKYGQILTMFSLLQQENHGTQS